VSHFVELPGGRLETLKIEGAADKPALVLLHEGLGCVGLWRDFPQKLARATGRTVWAYSRYGYGASAPCALPRPLDYLKPEALDILPAWLAACGIGRHVLIGHSDGASQALWHAGTAPRPNLAGLVCMAPHVFVEDISVSSIAEAKTAYEQGDLRDRLARWHGDNVDVAFRGWNDAWLDPGFRAWNIEPSLPGIAQDVLLIQGAEDEYGTLAQLDAIERSVSGRCNTLVLPDCRHSPWRDRESEVLAALSQFVEDLV